LRLRETKAPLEAALMPPTWSPLLKLCEPWSVTFSGASVPGMKTVSVTAAALRKS